VDFTAPMMCIKFFQVQEDLKQWNMKLAQRLVEFQGRVLPQEKIVQGQDIKYDAGQQTDWTKELRSK
jgi:diadenosine tetraphosphate (Ap4A) HIT family hydrolase